MSCGRSSSVNSGVQFAHENVDRGIVHAPLVNAKPTTSYQQQTRQNQNRRSQGRITRRKHMQRIARKLWLFLTCISLLTGVSTTASAQTPTGQIEPRAGKWQTWVLKSGSELRVRPPPDVQATASEIQELRALTGQRDAATLERIRYWDFSSPAYRWNEMLT